MNSSGKSFRIFIYHRIGAEDSLDGMTISCERFVEQMERIRKYSVPVLLSELVQALIDQRPIPDRAVAVTFDDGYRDTFTEAFPILQRLKIPATVFVATGFIDGLQKKRGVPLSWGMLKRMQRAGIEVGSHTVTHTNLTTCTPEQVVDELVASKQRIERMLSTPAVLLAYPYGTPSSLTESIREQAQAVGYRGACTTWWGRNSIQTDRYLLRRISPLRNQMRRIAEQLVQTESCDFDDHVDPLNGITEQVALLWKKNYGWVKHAAGLSRRR